MIKVIRSRSNRICSGFFLCRGGFMGTLVSHRIISTGRLKMLPAEQHTMGILRVYKKSMGGSSLSASNCSNSPMSLIFLSFAKSIIFETISKVSASQALSPS